MPLCWTLFQLFPCLQRNFQSYQYISKTTSLGHVQALCVALLHFYHLLFKMWPSLRIGCCPDCLQVLHEAPVPRSSEPRRVPEGLGFRWAGLVVEHLDGIHVLILSANVLVHHQGWQAWPHHGSAEGAQLDHIAESLRAGLRQCDEPMGNDC